MRPDAQRLIPLDPRVVAWVAAGGLLSVAGGLLVAAKPAAAFDLAVLGVAAAVVAWRPYATLLLLLLLRASFAVRPSSTLVDMLTLGGAGLAVLLCARQVPGRRVTIPLLAFLLVALPSVPLLPSWDEGAKKLWLELPVVHEQYARTPSNELFELIHLAAALAIFAWAAWAVRTPRQLKGVVTVVLVSAAYPVLVGLHDIVTGRTHTRPNGFASVEGLFSHPNGFASYLLVVMVLALVALLESRSLWPRVGLALLLAGGLVCLLYTYTRAAWIGFAIAVLLLAVVRYRRLLVVALIILVVAGFAAPSATDRAAQRFSDLSSSSASYSENSWSWRTKQWRKMVPFGIEEPFFGRGFGSYTRDTLLVFGTENSQFSTKPRTPHAALGFGSHNDYVKAIVETGLVGLGLWVLTLTGLISVAVRSRRVRAVAPWATAMLGIAVALSLVSVADNVQAAAVDMMYAFGLCGAVAGAALRPRAQAAGPEVETAPAVAKEPEPESEPKPEPEPEREPAPQVSPPVRPTSLSSVRTRLGAWLRGRR